MIDTAMTDALGRFLDVDVARYKLVTMNLANIDTPGYRTRDLDFRAELRRSAAAAAAAQAESGAEFGEEYTKDYGDEDAQPVLASFHAAFSPQPRPVRGLMERPDGNNVSVERESLLLADVQMKYNLGVQLLKDQFHLISTAINSGGATS
jgi:flagellar basal-body rod protein FlgB